MQDTETIVRCPKCRELMEPREVTGHYGAKLAIFHCPQCSGIWVDKDIAFAISRDSAVEVESDVDLAEIQSQPREAPIFCPRCEIYLMEQTGGGLPKGLRIDYCTDCHGFWFDKGELMIYKSFLEEKREKSLKRLEESEEKRRKKRELFEKSNREFNMGNSMIPSLVGTRILFNLLRLVK